MMAGRFFAPPKCSNSHPTVLLDIFYGLSIGVDDEHNKKTLKPHVYLTSKVATLICASPSSTNSKPQSAEIQVCAFICTKSGVLKYADQAVSLERDLSKALHNARRKQMIMAALCRSVKQRAATRPRALSQHTAQMAEDFLSTLAYKGADDDVAAHDILLAPTVTPGNEYAIRNKADSEALVVASIRRRTTCSKFLQNFTALNNLQIMLSVAIA